MKTIKHKKHAKPRIGFIGQGFVGKAIADDFEHRGFEVVRYALEKEYMQNKLPVQACDIVFIAVPTPTVRKKQNISALYESLALLNAGTNTKNKIVIIKSTILPRTTDMLQEKFRNLFLIHSPEFLIAQSAAKDATKPFMNIIGIPAPRFDKERNGTRITRIVSLLPHTPTTLICTSVEAETIKYCHNIHGYFQIVFWNMMHDYVAASGADWQTIKKAIDADPMISGYYTNPVHKNGRGAGGHCFIKDYAAFKTSFAKTNTRDTTAQKIISLIEKKNLMLLAASQKDSSLVQQVYGKRSYTQP